MNIIRPRTHQSSREGITREPGRHVGTILALMLVGGTSVPFGQEIAGLSRCGYLPPLLH